MRWVTSVRIFNLPLYLWILAPMGYANASMANATSHKPAVESSMEKQIRLAKEEGAEEARKDLAAGNPKQYRSSGIVGAQYRYKVGGTEPIRAHGAVITAGS
jgi:hypothetical protein